MTHIMNGRKRKLILALFSFALCASTEAGIYNGTFNEGAGAYIYAGQLPVSSDIVISPNSENSIYWIYTLSLTFSTADSVGGMYGALTLPEYTYYVDGNPVTPTQSFDLGDFKPSTDHLTWSEPFSTSSLISWNPNTTWTLAIQSPNFGAENTIMGWSLEITAVPEPVNVALVCFGALAASISLIRWRMKLARISPGNSGL